jgi:hypothetical protein
MYFPQEDVYKVNLYTKSSPSISAAIQGKQLFSRLKLTSPRRWTCLCSSVLTAITATTCSKSQICYIASPHAKLSQEKTLGFKGEVI